MSRRSSPLAGFQVTFIGRIWVTAEGYVSSALLVEPGHWITSTGFLSQSRACEGTAQRRNSQPSFWYPARSSTSTPDWNLRAGTSPGATGLSPAFQQVFLSIPRVKNPGAGFPRHLFETVVSNFERVLLRDGVYCLFGLLNFPQCHVNPNIFQDVRNLTK